MLCVVRMYSNSSASDRVDGPVEFCAGPVGHGRLGDDLAGEAQAVGHDADVVFMGEVARVDLGLVAEVAGAQPHRAQWSGPG